MDENIINRPEYEVQQNRIKSERGFALVVVVMLSALMLVALTTVIYMVSQGTRMSGSSKGYRTALEAALGGAEIFYRVLDTRGDTGRLTSLKQDYEAAAIGIPVNFTTPITCTETATGPTGTARTGIQAKIMTETTFWSNCNNSAIIDPSVPSSYDMIAVLGKYNVYVKLIASTDGNTSSTGANRWVYLGVVHGNVGKTMAMTQPYLYSMEVLAENDVDRASLSILYQF